MNRVYEHSHFGGTEVLLVRHPEVGAEIDEIISRVVPAPATRSRHSTKEGRPSPSSAQIKRLFTHEFRSRGYVELRDSHTIELPGYAVRIKGAYKQVDFVKGRVLVEVQFGKYFAMFYDMAKFQYFFNENRADVGVEIVPCVRLKRQMSSGVSYGEQLVFDIERLKRHFPTVPIKVILIDMETGAEPPAGEVVEPEGL